MLPELLTEVQRLREENERLRASSAASPLTVVAARALAADGQPSSLTSVGAVAEAEAETAWQEAQEEARGAARREAELREGRARAEEEAQASRVEASRAAAAAAATTAAAAAANEQVCSELHATKLELEEVRSATNASTHEISHEMRSELDVAREEARAAREAAGEAAAREAAARRELELTQARLHSEAAQASD